MEREKILQQRYGELQQQITEIQEAQLSSQQFNGTQQEENKDVEIVSDNIYESNNFSEGLHQSSTVIESADMSVTL